MGNKSKVRRKKCNQSKLRAPIMELARSFRHKPLHAAETAKDLIENRPASRSNTIVTDSSMSNFDVMMQEKTTDGESFSPKRIVLTDLTNVIPDATSVPNIMQEQYVDMEDTLPEISESSSNSIVTVSNLKVLMQKKDTDGEFLDPERIVLEDLTYVTPNTTPTSDYDIMREPYEDNEDTIPELPESRSNSIVTVMMQKQDTVGELFGPERPCNKIHRTYRNKRKCSYKTRTRKKEKPREKRSTENLFTDDNNWRRIVDLKYFLHQLKIISNHSGFGCGLQNLELLNEKRIGLFSKLSFKCNMCNLKFTINTCNVDSDSKLNINMAAVIAITTIGIGFSQFSELLTTMDVPSMSQKMYDDTNHTISIEWEQSATLAMEAAAEREKQAAIEEGSVKDGKAVIDVIVDGFWGKRSYNRNYSALSGGAAIIGRKFKQVLFLGIKNKYCCICARAANKKVEPKEHICYKNYTGPSTGMEASIILDGFKNSISMYDVIFGRMIADGDCSTYKKIIEARPYPGHTVEKIECRNHLLRNMCSKLIALSRDTKYSKSTRDLITTPRILAIRKAICLAIKEHKNGDKDISERINDLYVDISNSYIHAFGQHNQCKSYYCQSEKKSANLVDLLNFSAIWQKIQLIVGILASNARSLIHDVDSNCVESFNSIVAKFVGGKRVNLSLRKQYQSRCFAAVVSFNTKRPMHYLGKKMLGRSPKCAARRRFDDRRLKKAKTGQSACKRLKFKIKESSNVRTDENYGENCEKPDMCPEVYKMAQKRFLTDLIKTYEQRKSIERSTILQRDSSEWLELRRNLITASNFGKIINKRDTTGPTIVKNLLYKQNLTSVPAIKHGIENEKTALDQMSQQLEINIDSCGLFIDEEVPYIGATPDGLVGDDSVVEIKCPLSIYDYTSVEEAVSNKKLPFYQLVNGNLIINKRHAWYYQAQGQLHITKRKYCLFGVWYGANKSMKIEKIERDDKLWDTHMLPKLKDFYMQHVLPELVDPRQTRNMPLRNPSMKESGTKRKAATPMSIDAKRMKE